MTIGLITESRSYTGKNLFKKYFRRWKKEYIPGNKIIPDIEAVVIPYTRKKLLSMDDKKLEKVLDRAEKKAAKYKVNAVIYSEFLTEICKGKSHIKKEIYQAGEMLFIKLIPDCIRVTAKKCGINLLNSCICIKCSKMERIIEYLMRNLCFDTKKLVLAISDTKDAADACDRFFEETGLSVEISEDMFPKADIVIDVERAEVEIVNNLFIRDIDLSLDLMGYKARDIDIAVYAGNLNASDFSCRYDFKCKRQVE
jgi:hypothetical protein